MTKLLLRIALPILAAAAAGELEGSTSHRVVSDDAERDGGSQDDEKPNLLFIVTDQQRHDALGVVQEMMPQYRNKLHVRTPNIDRLARNGAIFEKAYCVSPVCFPSRTSLYTGSTVQRTGALQNGWSTFSRRWDVLEEKVRQLETFEQLLVDKLGYVAEYYGKLHRPSTQYYSREHPEKNIISYNQYNFTDRTPVFKHMGTYSGHYRDVLEYLLPRDKVDVRRRSEHVENYYSHQPYIPYIRGMGYFGFGRDSLDENHTEAAIVGREAMWALDRLIASRKPWSLSVHFNPPHPPVVASTRWLDYYHRNRHRLFVSPSINDTLKNSAYAPANFYFNSTLVEEKRKQTVELTAVYYSMIEEVDDWVGKLLGRLKEAGLDKKTMVVFTSDHGEFLGAHGQREKMKLLEEPNRVPLIISYPGKIPSNHRVKDLVSHIDLFSTVLDFLGGSQFDKSDGTSLRRFIEQTSFNELYDEHNVVVEFDGRQVKKRFGKVSFNEPLGRRPSFMIRKGNFNLILPRSRNSTVLDMMYNLEVDPYEMHNLLGHNAKNANYDVIGKAEHLKCLLVEWMKRMDGRKGYYSNPAFNMGAGEGDIEEIKNWRTWKEVDLWLSDQSLLFNNPPVLKEDKYIWNEYLYVGRTKPGILSIRDIGVKGSDSSYFSVDRTSATITQNEYVSIKVSFTAPMDDTPLRSPKEAFVQFKTNVQGEKVQQVRIVMRHE